MRAAVLEAFGAPMPVRELAPRDPADHEVLVRTVAAPFCSTDWLGWRAMRGKIPPVVLGHTALGVVERGDGGARGYGVGDLVVVAGTPQCDECFYCGIGRPDQCALLFERPEPVVATDPEGRPVRAAGGVGAYAELVVTDRSQVRSSAESVDLAAQVGRVAAPLRQQVLDVLRQAILSFHYAPGQRLIERELIEEIGVSRTTIREALRELAAEGLVKTIPQKGAVVVVPSPQEALELYELRAVLEALAVRRFTEVASDEQVAELRAAFEQLAEAASGDGDTLRVLKAKDHFYDVLLRGCGNRSVHSTLGGVQARLSLLRATSLAQPGRVERSVQELRTMVEAVEARNAEAAVRACNHHIEQAKRAGLEGLSATSGLPFSNATA